MSRDENYGKGGVPKVPITTTVSVTYRALEFGPNRACLWAVMDLIGAYTKVKTYLDKGDVVKVLVTDDGRPTCYITTEQLKEQAKKAGYVEEEGEVYDASWLSLNKREDSIKHHLRDAYSFWASKELYERASNGFFTRPKEMPVKVTMDLGLDKAPETKDDVKRTHLTNDEVKGLCDKVRARITPNCSGDDIGEMFQEALLEFWKSKEEQVETPMIGKSLDINADRKFNFMGMDLGSGTCLDTFFSLDLEKQTLNKQQEESNMTNSISSYSLRDNTRRVVNIQLIDDDSGLDVSQALVASFEGIATEDDNTTTIQQLMMDKNVKAELDKHNEARVKVVNKDILNRTGQEVKLQPIKIKDLRWVVQ